MTSKLQNEYEALLAGDCSARDRLIVAAMPVSGKTADSFCAMYREYKSHRDDLVSEGYVAIIKRVDEWAALKWLRTIPPELDLSRHCFIACLAYAVESRLIGPTWPAVLKRIQRARQDNPAETEEEWRELCRAAFQKDAPEIGELLEEDSTFAAGGSDEDAIHEALSVCVTDKERDIINDQLQDLSLDKIAARLGCHISTVYRIRQRLGRRVNSWFEFLAS